MINLFRWIQKNIYPVHTLAFVLMILASLGMYAAAEKGSPAGMWALMAVFVAANLLALLAR
jgi:hypothetical protein